MEPIAAIDIGVPLAVINDIKDLRDNETNNAKLSYMMRNARIKDLQRGYT